jgi:hypothetical protein
LDIFSFLNHCPSFPPAPRARCLSRTLCSREFHPQEPDRLRMCVCQHDCCRARNFTVVLPRIEFGHVRRSGLVTRAAWMYGFSPRCFLHACFDSYLVSQRPVFMVSRPLGGKLKSPQRWSLTG